MNKSSFNFDRIIKINDSAYSNYHSSIKVKCLYLYM